MQLLPLLDPTMQHSRLPPAPPPLFRRPSSASSSSVPYSATSVSEETSDDSSSDESDSDDETDGYYSSSGISGDEGAFIRRLDASLAGGGRAQEGGKRFFDGTSTPRGPGGATSARSNLKLSLAVLRARQSLGTESYAALGEALKSLSAAFPPLSALSVPNNEGEYPLGVFVPVLHRLAQDIRASISSDEKGRDARKKLAKEDAKALIALRQRWSGSGKGKGKETSTEWASTMEDLVLKNPPPAFLYDPSHLACNRALLTSLEASLLPSSLPRLSLSGLSLDDRDLEVWPALRRLLEVVAWYFSFVTSNPSEADRRARRAMDEIRSLDLSKNKLSTFPFYLTRLFPHLETLSLSHNLFVHIPAWVALFSSLRRLRIHGDHLISSRKALKPLCCDSRSRKRRRPPGRQANTREIVPLLREQLRTAVPAELFPNSDTRSPTPLFSIATQLAQGYSVSSHLSLEDDLPPHLVEAIEASYACASCARFILLSSPSYVPPFWERLLHLDPGISLPSRIPPPIRSPTPPFGSPTSPPTFPSPFAERPATIEQRVLLALLARLDTRPPPPPPRAIRRASSSNSLASFASTSSASGPPRRGPTRRERDRENNVLPTLVVGGDGEQGRGYRFCTVCAAAHLGMEDELAAAGILWECGCVVCKEERRVRDGEPEGGEKDAEGRNKAKVMRWLRRKERVDVGGAVGIDGLRIV